MGGRLGDHRKRFERWRARLPPHTAYFVELVLTRVVPEFEKRGFVWYPDYAGGDSTQIGANDIPLQRRSGDLWPTVQILFSKRYAPSLGLTFAALPRICKRWVDDRFVDIPREKALVFEGTAYFSLCKSRNGGCNYGYRWFSLFPRRHLDSEIDLLLRLLPEVFELFDRGIPSEWAQRQFGRVTDHVLVMGSRLAEFVGSGQGHK